MLATCISTCVGALGVGLLQRVALEHFSLARGQVAGLKTTCRSLSQALDKWFCLGYVPHPPIGFAQSYNDSLGQLDNLEHRM
jgi:hypothetical protein